MDNRDAISRPRHESCREPTSSLDEIDFFLLDLLQRDCSVSVNDLAEAAHLTPSPCWRRINRLKEEGYIRRQVALLSSEKLGLGTVVFVNIRLSAQARPKLMEFAETMKRIPEVTECFVTLGSSDFLLKVITKDIKTYETFFFNRLSILPDIEEIQSTIALAEIKVTTELPIFRRALGESEVRYRSNDA